MPVLSASAPSSRLFLWFHRMFFSVAAFKWFTILLFLQRVLVKIAWEPHRFERAVFYLHVIPEWQCVICMTKLVRVRGASSELYRVWGETDPFHRCCGLKYASFRFCWPCRVLATSGVVAVYWKWAVLIMSQNHFIGWEYIYIYIYIYILCILYIKCASTGCFTIPRGHWLGVVNGCEVMQLTLYVALHILHYRLSYYVYRTCFC